MYTILLRHNPFLPLSQKKASPRDDTWRPLRTTRGISWFFLNFFSLKKLHLRTSFGGFQEILEGFCVNLRRLFCNLSLIYLLFHFFFIFYFNSFNGYLFDVMISKKKISWHSWIQNIFLDLLTPIVIYIF